jgi:Flp pilus assembly protein TadB
VHSGRLRAVEGSTAALAATVASSGERRLIGVFWIIAIILIVILAVAVLSFALHLLFSPWLWVVAIIGIATWFGLRAHRSRP